MANSTPENSSSPKNVITYCDRCGVRIEAQRRADEVGGLCEDCIKGGNKPRQRAADSSQIPYVEAPADAEVLRDIRENVPERS